MSEAKAKKKLEEVALRWNGRASVDQILHVFKNSQNRYSNEKLLDIAKQYLRNHLVDGDKLLTQFETNIKKNQKTPYEAFVIMLNNGTVITSSNSNLQQQQKSQQIHKPQIPVKPSNLQIESTLSNKTDFDSPALCSTRLENNAQEIVVSEVSIFFLIDLFLRLA